MNRIINLLIVAVCSLSLISSVKPEHQSDSNSKRVHLKRTRTYRGAQSTLDRVTGFLGKRPQAFQDIVSIITQKNVDGDSVPIQHLMDEWSKDHKKQQGWKADGLAKQFIDIIEDSLKGLDIFTKFGLKAAGPENFNKHKEQLKQGEIDFSDFDETTGTGDKEMFDQAFDVFSKLEERRIREQLAAKGISEESHIRRHGPLVRVDKRIDISNYINFQYTGPVYMGSEPEKLTVIYDTGSDWLALDTEFCESCIQPVFNTSSSFTYRNESTTEIDQMYGSAQLVALNASDQISLDNSTDTKLLSFNFLAIISQVGIQQTFDGILGLSRQMVLPDLGFENGPLLIQKMKEASIISREQISFYITTYKEQSFCDLGAYDIRNVRYDDQNQIVWLPMPKPNTLFWYSFLEGIIYESPESTRMSKVGYTSQIRIDPMPAIFDTGTSLIYVPQSHGDDFMYRLVFGKRYIQTNGMFQINCEERDLYSDVYFVINNKLFQISHEDYVIEVEGICLLAFVVHPNEFWLLGDAFLMGYYSIHDNEDRDNARVGFAPHKTSKKPGITDFQASSIKNYYKDLTWEKTWIYDWYWFWQLELFMDIPVLDSNWAYFVPAWLWANVIGVQSVVIKAFTSISQQMGSGTAPKSNV